MSFDAGRRTTKIKGRSLSVVDDAGPKGLAPCLLISDSGIHSARSMQPRSSLHVRSSFCYCTQITEGSCEYKPE